MCGARMTTRVFKSVIDDRRTIAADTDVVIVGHCAEHAAGLLIHPQRPRLNLTFVWSFDMSLSSWLWGASQVDEAIGEYFFVFDADVTQLMHEQTRPLPSSCQPAQRISHSILKFQTKFVQKLCHRKMLCALSNGD